MNIKDVAMLKYYIMAYICRVGVLFSITTVYITIQAMTDLLSSQAKVKYLNAAKDGKYKMVCKSQESREAEWQRQVEKLRSIQAIVERLEEDYPASESQLKPLSLSLKSKVAQGTKVKTHKVVEVA